MWLLFFLLNLWIPGKETASSAFHFAIVSDTHIGGAATASEDLQRTVEDINSDTCLAFTIITGDITELGSDAELAEAYNILKQLRKPWYVIPGNHDTKWSESGNNSFRQVFGYERFCFEYGGYTFAGCSSGPNMRMAPGLVPAEDLVWLDSIISHLPENRPLFFFNHYPLDPGLGNWYKVIDLLKKANTQAAFCGHGHANKALDAEGIPATMCRSNLRAKADTGAYNIVTVFPDTLFVATRKPGSNTAAAWRSIALGLREYQSDTTAFERPSYAVNSKYPQMRLGWRLQDPCDIGAGIAVDGDLAIYANTCGEVKGIYVSTGEARWSFSTRGKIYSTPAIAEGRAVIASADSSIYCLEAASGAPLWQQKTGKAIVASPVIDNGLVYIGSSEGIFRALSLKDGSILWEFSGVKGFVETRPAIDEARVYFGAWDTHFYALNRKDGSLAWSWNNGSSNRMYSPAAVFPVVSNGKVFIVAPDRFATALDAPTGKEIWRSNKKIGRESLGISSDGSTLYVKSMNDTVYAITTSDNAFKIRWYSHCDYGYDIAPSPMTERKGIVYIPTDKGMVIALGADSQQVRWVHKVCNALINSVAPLDNGAVLGTAMDGVVFYLIPQ